MPIRRLRKEVLMIVRIRVGSLLSLYFVALLLWFGLISSDRSFKAATFRG